MKRRGWLGLLVLLLLVACSGPIGLSTLPTPTLPLDLQTRFPKSTPTLLPRYQTATFEARLADTVEAALTATGRVVTLLPPALPVPTGTPDPPAPEPTPTPAFSPMPDRFAGLRIEELRARSYGEGELVVEEVWGELDGFTRSMVRYDSDGLVQYAFMNVPAGEGPFPVVIVVHGYVSPANYNMLAYTTPYADTLARAGYLVIHPNLRGYPPAEDGPNLHRVGFAVDVLNLVGLVRRLGGQPGPLAQADPQAIGLFGHSMGGGVSIRAAVVDGGIDAVVLYGSMSADEALNTAQIYNVFMNAASRIPELDTPPEVEAEISPVYYLEGLAGSVSIHHGDADPTVPVSWSKDLCLRLLDLGKQAECFFYPGEGHSFRGEANAQFLERVIQFFDRELRGAAGGQ